MVDFNLGTPALLFSAVSLVLLAYTNRFMGYAQLVRNLKVDYKKNPDALMLSQILNLRQRLHLTRLMQYWGIMSLFLCVVTMFFIYVGWQDIAVAVFAIALISLIISLGVSIWEIHISVKSINIHLADLVKIYNDQKELDKEQKKNNDKSNDK